MYTISRNFTGERVFIMGKSATTAKNKYNSKNYDRINLVVPKGKKDEYKLMAEAEGKSLNQFIVDKMEGQEMVNGFKEYLERLKQKYDSCNDEKEKKILSKKISDCEELIKDLEQ